MTRNTYRFPTVSHLLVIFLANSILFEADRVAAGPPVVPRPGVFPIGCFPGPPPELNQHKHWRAIRDAGFTLACPEYRYDRAGQLAVLDHCERVGLKAVVNVKFIPRDGDEPMPAGWKSEVTRIIDTFSSHPAFFGYMLRDEPNANEFGLLRQATLQFLRQDPEHATCINLFPTYATAEQLGTETYLEYLDRYMGTVQPPFLSYDHYPLKKNDEDTPDYFLNLELVRRTSLKYDTPAWNILLSTPWPYFRTPNEGEMRWQAYTSLAYGIKGFFYFTYWSVNKEAVAIVDIEGRPGPLYPVVRQLNSEILNLGRTLLQLRSTGVYHSGGALPEGCEPPPDDLPFSVAGKMPVIAGYFEGPESSKYVMFANGNHGEPLELAAQLSHSIAELRRVSEEDGLLHPVRIVAGAFRTTLPPGGGVLLRFQRE